MQSNIDEIADRINNTEQERIKLADFVKPHIKKLTVPFEKFSGTVAATDGGLLAKSFHGSDVVVTKAVSVVMDYLDGKLNSTNYFPELHTPPQTYFSQKGLDYSEVDCSKSILRIKHEIRNARNTISKFAPDYMLLDGSIVPQQADKPKPESVLLDDYKSLVELYSELYNTANNYGTQLVGIVEDSRANRFVNSHLPALPKDLESIARQTQDTHLLYYLLEKGEKTSGFTYAENPSKHPILQDFSSELGAWPMVFYLRTAEYDRPLRIEYLNPAKSGETEQNVAKMAYFLASFNKEYGIPAPIIEADLRAALDSKELDFICNKISDKLTHKGAMLELRRNKRPFK
ncbi:MAG: DNA double-strand break repair nuclease NurA [Candidatus Diapherotrites archaeon]|nr:DNA double-strand break repair nuclease NurA [Candidatus Diapherotrites archaeon]